MVKAEIDLREFEKALDKAIQYSSRSTQDVINAACLDIIIKSAEAIPKADKKKMEKELYGPIEVVTIGKSGKTFKNPRLVRHPSRLIYNIINARRRKKGLPAISGDDMRKEAQKLISARMRSVGYIAYAGFQKAVLAFGGRGFGSRAGILNEKSKAARGYGFKAAGTILWAEFTNRAEHAFEIGGQVVQRVVDWKAQDIKQHLESKLKRDFDRI